MDAFGNIRLMFGVSGFSFAPAEQPNVRLFHSFDCLKYLERADFCVVKGGV